MRELVDQHQAENLTAVFRQHSSEIHAVERRISERFDLCQEIIAQNVRKLRDEQTEFAGHFTNELANLRRGLMEQES